MKIVAVTNQKGGSGKTTTAVNLAAALGEKRKKVLVVDLDPQASASAWLGVADGGRGLIDALAGDGDLSGLVQATREKGVSLIPSSAWLGGADQALAQEPGAELILRGALERLAQGGPWDYCFLDCPPSLGLLAVSALAAAGEVLVPVEAHVLALQGLAQLTKTLAVVRTRLNPGLTLAGVIPCRVARTRHAAEVVERIREAFPDQAFRSSIRENVRIPEAPAFALSVLP